MFALDTNILVYAHNVSSPFHFRAKAFIEHVMAEVNGTPITSVGLPLQVCAEFVNVCTRQSLITPLSLPEAIRILRRYTAFLETPIIFPKPTQLQTFLSLLEGTTTRKKVFDVALAATLSDNHVEGLYTVNVDDFKDFDFLRVVNPLS